MGNILEIKNLTVEYTNTNNNKKNNYSHYTFIVINIIVESG